MQRQFLSVQSWSGLGLCVELEDLYVRDLQILLPVGCVGFCSWIFLHLFKMQSPFHGRNDNDLMVLFFIAAFLLRSKNTTWSWDEVLNSTCSGNIRTRRRFLTIINVVREAMSDVVSIRINDGPTRTTSWCIIPKGQWPFQEPKLEVPTIYKAYVSGLCKGISPQNMALYGTVPPF